MDETAPLILMATFNGAQDLPDQLDSFRQQSVPWRLLVSDDGSQDATPEILAQFATQNPTRSVTLLPGPGRGCTVNFLSLLRAAPSDSAFIALADQDDVWLPDKLARARAALATEGATGGAQRPALYCSQVWVCNEKLEHRRLSRRTVRPPSFANALVENIAGGNTIMLNNAALRLAQAQAHTAEGVFAHDWWLYLLISGVGGRVIYDPEPSMLYRQHAGNLIGAGSGWSQPLRVLAGDFADRVGRNITALEAVTAELTPDNRAILEQVRRARRQAAPFSALELWRAGIYRQTLRGTVGLWGAALLGRV